MAASKSVSIVTSRQFAALREKGISGVFPQILYPDPTFPAFTFHLWPIPSHTFTLHLMYWGALQRFGAAGDAVSFPPGFYDAIVANLAVQLCQSYRRPIPDGLVAIAQGSKQMMQEINAQILSGSFQETLTGMGPNVGSIIPHALAPLEPRLLPGSTGGEKSETGGK